MSALRGHEGPVYVSEDVPRHVARIRALLVRAAIEPNRSVFLSDHADVQGHWVDRLLRFGSITPTVIDANKYAAESVDFRAAPQLYVTSAERDECETWLRERGASKRPIVLVQPGNKRAARWNLRRKRDPKQWPASSWVQLLRAIRAQLPDACLLLCGARAETQMLAQISASAACTVEVATNELPLRRMLALMSMAHSMVAVDTGPAHMAAAVGCPF